MGGFGFGFGYGFRGVGATIGVLSHVSRYFTTLASASSKYYEIDPVTLAVGDIVRIDFEAPTGGLSSTQYLMDSPTASDRAVVGLTSGGNFIIEVVFGATFLLDGVSVSSTSSHPTDGEMHMMELTVETAGRVIGNLGMRYNNSFFFSGILKDFQIERAGELIRDIPLNEHWVDSNVVHDKATVLGPEQYAFSEVGALGGGTVTETSTGFTFNHPTNSGDRTFVNLTTEAGVTYVLNVTTVSGIVMTAFVRDGINGNGTVLESKGLSIGGVSNEFIFMAASTTTTILFDVSSGSDQYNYELSNITIKKATGYGEAINIVQADAELFKLNTSTSPDQWENLDLTRIIPIAGTP